VPWQYKGKDVTVIYTASTLEIYHKSIRIASHQREKERGYTTLKEHMPSQHRFYAEQSPEETILTKGKVALSFQSNFQRIDEEGYKELSPQLLKSSIWASCELPF